MEHSGFIHYLNQNRHKSITDIVRPSQDYEGSLRELFAQQPDHHALKDSHANLISLFAAPRLNVRARNLEVESAEQQDKYIMPLRRDERKAEGTAATVQSLDEFKNNFNVFSEGSLVDMDWSNVILIGSALTTCLLPLPVEHAISKRATRKYYHEIVAPASDVDLFLYGLDEKATEEKIKEIEDTVRNSVLAETITVRIKIAITIISKCPARHVQIVLRCYKSVAEILTGFDVDSAYVGFDGSNVFMSPRAAVSFATQCNVIDLTRRSPSYENRLAKYRQRASRSIGRTWSANVWIPPYTSARSDLPKETDRGQYMDKRRQERGRPPANRSMRRSNKLQGNLKEDAIEPPEWMQDDGVSNYHTFTTPYGPNFHASKIQRLLYTKDILLNAEWSRPEERVLHRYPAFFGAAASEAMSDCCGACPLPQTDEQCETAEQEKKIYIQGRVTFITDNPGRQAIGSFNPITTNDWTEMAYVSDTALLCQAIVDADLQQVKKICSNGVIDINQSDYCGRTPLHLAVITSSAEIVSCLLEQGSRIIARLADGKTSLHLAAERGNKDILKAILDRSEANERQEIPDEGSTSMNTDLTGDQQLAGGEVQFDDTAGSVTGQSDEETADDITEGPFVKVRRGQLEENIAEDDDRNEPDVLDVNVIAWDKKVTALHTGVAYSNISVVETLVSDYGADPLLPVKLVNAHSNSPTAAIMPLVLTTRLPQEDMLAQTRSLLALGVSSAQADMNLVTAFQYFVAAAPRALRVIFDHDGPTAKRVVNHITFPEYLKGQEGWDTALTLAIRAKDEETADSLLQQGADAEISLESFERSRRARNAESSRYGRNVLYM